MLDSPMPAVLRVRQTQPVSSGNSRAIQGNTSWLNIGRNSRGGPGNITNHDRRPSDRNGLGEASIISPGAVP